MHSVNQDVLEKAMKIIKDKGGKDKVIEEFNNHKQANMDLLAVVDKKDMCIDV